MDVQFAFDNYTNKNKRTANIMKYVNQSVEYCNSDLRKQFSIKLPVQNSQVSRTTTSSATEMNKIKTKVLKSIKEYIAYPLVYIMNNVIDTC